jgi:predicted extracellular nuclease/Ca2+-binding RTX toxin-like protein
MKTKSHVLRNDNQTWSDFVESLRADILSPFGHHRGDVFAKTVTTAGPQTAQAPAEEPQNAVPPVISLTTSGVAYTQNFDTLSNTAGSLTNNLTIDGWTFTETGSGARDNEQYAVDTGASTTGDTFSYGSAPGGIPSAERALGQLRSGTLISTIGASFTNSTGGTITSLLISYDGEQWRFGGVHSTVADKLDFQISFNATSVTDAGPGVVWTDVNALDFLAPITAGAATALDGNAAANRTALSSNITSLTIANGATFWIRWLDVDATGSDDGLAIDNFSMTPTATAPPAETQTVVFNPTSVTHNEGNTGTTAYSFTVTRTGGTLGQLDFSGTIAAGSTDNADYVGGTAPTTFSGAILAGQTSATVTVNVQGDYTIEPSESFTLTLTTASNTDGTVSVNIGASPTATGNITNDDTPGAISVADVSIAEGDAGTTPGSFTLSRTGGATGTVSVDYVITLPGGVGGADSSDVSATLTGTVTFLEGETSATIPFTINGDVTNEPDETFTVALSNPQGGATIGDASGTATITNDDAPPTVSIGDASVVEGNDGVTYLVFTVTLSKVSIDPVTVDFSTSGVTATADSDYLELSGQVSFDPGETVQTVSVPVIGDNAPENAETLTVTLANPSGASISDGSATGTITNDDGASYYSLAAGSFTQAWTNTAQITAADNWSGVPYIIGYLGDIDAGSTTNVDPRTLTGAALGAIDVIANLTATTNTSGGVGEFEITNPTIGLQGSGTADAPSIVLYMDASGRSSVRLQANLRDIDTTADDAAQQVNVQYRTSATGSWTNVPGAYFSDVTTAGTATQVTVLDVILPAGANNAPTLEIRIMTTNAAGSDEWVGIDDIVVSSAVSGPSLSIANAAVFEGDSGPSIITFTVTRAGTSTGEVTADYEVEFGSGPFAAGTDDFTALTPLSGQVVFADGQTTATITVSVNGDIGPEGDENFTVTLSNPVGATISDASATGTIVNDDGPPPLVTINDVTVTEGDAGTSLMTFTVTRTGGTGAFDVDWETADGSATAGEDYVATSGTVHFADGQMTDTVTIAITVNGDTDAELGETLQVLLSNATNFALITDAIGIGTIAGDDPIYIHDIQGTSYYSPILAGEGISGFNIASAGSVIVRAVVTAVDNDGPRQGYYLAEEVTDWDGNSYTSEGIFVMTRNDAGVGSVVSGVSVGDLVQVSAHVMEYQAFNTMPRTMLVNSTGLQLLSSGNSLPTLTLTNMTNEVMTAVTPDYTDSSDGVGDTFDASVYALSYFETVEGMLVTIPNMVVADGFVSTSGGDPFLQAYSLDSANADQINSRGGYTIAGDPPIGPPDTAGTTGDDTVRGGRHLHDGDVNPDIIEIDFTGFAMSPPTGLTQNATMGDLLGDVTGIIDFDFTDRKLFVTAMEPGGFVDGGSPTQEVTVLGDDTRSLTVATFNVENLDPGDGAARFTALANAIATNLNSPDIISIEEMQDNNGATASGGADASTTWQMLVDALNLATGANYQWVDQEPNAGTEGGEPGGNIRVGFIYNTDRVQLGDLDASATLAERRMYTDRIGDGVRDAGDLIAFSDNMLGAEINTADWAGTRRSLLGEFTFHGNTVYVTANHWPAKGGSGEFWQFDQNLETGDPNNSGWSQRNQVGQDVYSMMDLIQTTDPNAGIAAGGDFNDFYFYRPLTTVTGYTLADGTARVGGSRFENLTLTLAEAERYSYTFDGRSQAIDHIIVNSLLGGVATYDVVHINTGFNALGADLALSDHDPALSSFDYREFSETLVGTSGNDMIDGYGGNDTISGLAGSDILAGNAGADTLQGGADNDTYLVEDALDTIVEVAGEGNRDIVYTSVNYTIAAGVDVEVLAAGSAAGTDPLQLIGNGIANEIYGNAGNNLIHGGGGADLLVGLLGNDIYYTDVAATQIIERAGEGNDIVYASVSYALGGNAEVETLSTNSHGATAAINLTGNFYAQTLIGNAGANILHGGGGADVLVGLGGNDIYYTDVAGVQVVEVAGGGSDIVYASVSYTLGGNAAVEILSTNLHAGTAAINLTGNGFDQTIFGNAGANILHGGGGTDMLYGLAGNDTYYVDVATTRVFENGGGGTDIVYASLSFTLGADQEIETLSTNAYASTAAINLTGNVYANTIIGNSGANVLDGQGGNDTLIGLDGADTFAFTTGLGAGNVDNVAGFVHNVDKIALDNAVFVGIGADGALNAGAFHTGSAAHDSDDRIIYDSATGQLFFDADGNGAGAAVQFATLSPGLGLTASDFQVI